MPRYSEINVRDYRLLPNPTSVRNRVPEADYSDLPAYANLSADAKLNWSGDINFDEKTGDVAVTFSVESYAQRLNNRLITQSGEFPEPGDFGWNFNYLYNMSVVEQRRMFPQIIRDIRDAAMDDPDTKKVEDVTVGIERNIDTFTHLIIVKLIVRPKSVDDLLEIIFEIGAGDQNANTV